jgi:hypothetical protein
LTIINLGNKVFIFSSPVLQIFTCYKLVGVGGGGVGLIGLGWVAGRRGGGMSDYMPVPCGDSQILPLSKIPTTLTSKCNSTVSGYPFLHIKFDNFWIEWD